MILLLTGHPDPEWNDNSGSGYFSGFFTKLIQSLQALLFSYLLHRLPTMERCICEYSNTLTISDFLDTTARNVFDY